MTGGEIKPAALRDGRHPLEGFPLEPHDPRRKVCFLIDKFGAGGAQTHLGSLIQNLDPSRYRATVVCLIRGGRTADELSERGLDVRVLGIGRLYGPRGIAALFRLAGWLRRQRIEILHTYLSAANVFGAVAARFARVPCLITTRRDTGFSDGALMRRALSLTGRWSRAVVAVSRDAADIARSRDGVPPERVRVIPNGIDRQRFRRHGRRREIRRRLSVPEDAPLVVAVGHVTPIKGIDVLLEAAPAVRQAAPETRFIVAGDGSEHDRIRARVRALNLGEVFELIGVYADVPGLLEACDLFVLPSRSEGMPNALLEAMAVGVPAIATRVGGVPEILTDGRDGLLVPPGDPRALAEACVRVLASPELSQRLAQGGYERVRQEFDLSVMMSRYASLYDELGPARQPGEVG